MTSAIRYVLRLGGQAASGARVNRKRVEELTRDGLMQPAGLKAFEARKESKSGIYAYEQSERGASSGL